MAKRLRANKPGPRGDPGWSAKELEILFRHYPQAGSQETHQRLLDAGFHRSERAVLNMAHKKMLAIGEIEGYTPVHTLSGTTSQRTYYQVLFNACRDGVLIELPNRRRKWIVPDEWADEWNAKREARRNERE